MFIQATIYTLGQGLSFNVVLPLWYLSMTVFGFVGN